MNSIVNLNKSLFSEEINQFISSFNLSEGRYNLRFAQTETELDYALKLRFEVFNLELGEGLHESFQTFRDKDKFDDQCHHLIVTDLNTSTVIGTYRLQTIESARSGEGFYSAGEFHLSEFPDDFLKNAVEVGRACISKEHRNSRVLFLLWQGLAAYVFNFKKRYFFGCCSLTSQNMDEGIWLMDFLQKNNFIHDTILINPLPDLICSKSTEFSHTGTVEIPRLFKAYLNYGGKVCSHPAIDREFKTIDFLVMVDILSLDEKTIQLFFPKDI